MQWRSPETAKRRWKEIPISKMTVPLAGAELHFTVKVVALRDPTKEELDHGHVHEEGHNH